MRRLIFWMLFTSMIICIPLLAYAYGQDSWLKGFYGGLETGKTEGFNEGYIYGIEDGRNLKEKELAPLLKKLTSTPTPSAPLASCSLPTGNWVFQGIDKATLAYPGGHFAEVVVRGSMVYFAVMTQAFQDSWEVGYVPEMTGDGMGYRIAVCPTEKPGHWEIWTEQVGESIPTPTPSTMEKIQG